MKSLYAFCLLFVLAFLPATSRPIDGELVIRLQEDEKLTGTFSGDIDQQTSVHLLFLKNKKDDHYIVKPFFIDAHRNITALETSVFKEEPSVVSYHLKDDMLTLLLQQGKRKEQNLEILEFNTLNGDVQQFTVANFKEPYLLLRTKEKTFLLNKEDDQVEVVTILGAGEPQKTTLNLTNVSKETIEKLFKEKPETINTEEFVEHGSILPSKLYYSGDKLVFDYKSEEEYFILTVDPASGAHNVFSTEFKDIEKVKEVNSYIYQNKAFLFINNREDLILRTYDIESQELLGELKLREEYMTNDELQKVIKKSSRKNFSLTAAVNEGLENTLLINLDCVATYEYFYHYNWWWHHTMFQNMMMQQMQISKPNLPFGPNVGEDNDLYFYYSSRPVQLVMDQNLKFIKTSAGTPVRPQFNKSKYLDIFENNDMVKEETISFTSGSVRTIYFSEVTKAVHLKIFD